MTEHNDEYYRTEEIFFPHIGNYRRCRLYLHVLYTMYNYTNYLWMKAVEKLEEIERSPYCYTLCIDRWAVANGQALRARDWKHAIQFLLDEFHREVLTKEGRQRRICH